MSSCPNCGAALASDFGMIPCLSCNAMLFIDMEGAAHLSLPAAPEPAAEERAVQDFESALDSSRDSEQEPGEIPEASFHSPSQDDPLALNAFANSELSLGKDGPYLFKVIISAIDSKETREIIREAMSDARFAWDADALISRISKGRLELTNVSPIKASVLINRLKSSQVSIRWEQSAVSEMEASEDDS